LDATLFQEAISEVLGHSDFDTNWESYTHITDTGLLLELLSRLRITDQAGFIDEVRALLFHKVDTCLASGAACRAVPGAKETLSDLRTAGMPFGVATGGWARTARLKLEHAGIDAPEFLSSSDDAVSRTGIMKHCLGKIGAGHRRAVYFGDAPWDHKATAELGWDFIGVGKRLEGRCDVWIQDFSDPRWLAAWQRVVADD